MSEHLPNEKRRNAPKTSRQSLPKTASTSYSAKAANNEVARVNGKAHVLADKAEPTVEFTIVEKADERLSKSYAIGPNGKLVADGSECGIVSGRMLRAYVRSLDDLQTGIAKLKPNQALVTGKMNAELGECALFVAKIFLQSGAFASDVVTRSQAHIAHRENKPGLALIDHDKKDAPPAVAARMEEVGGLDAALALLDPQLATVGFAERASTSTGIYNAETGEEFPGSGGTHRYAIAKDSADVPRYLKALVQRGWLHGLTDYVIGKGGQLLERSIIDASVGSPERLVFEAPPALTPPLKQRERAMTVRPGEWLDTAALPDLTLAEQAKINLAKQEARAALGKPLKEAREKAVATNAAEIIKKNRKITPERARRTAERQIDGVLLPSAIVEFDDPALGETTIADVLRDPDKYIEQPMADPLEGPEYGRSTAMLFRRDNGALWIFSFAHGRTDYRIVADHDYIAESMAAVKKERLAKWLVDIAADAEMSAVEEKTLIKRADETLGNGQIRALTDDLKAERDRRKKARDEARQQDFSASIKRVKFALLAEDAATSPILAEIDAVLCDVKSAEPPMRDINGAPVDIVERKPFGDLHTLTAAGANAEEDESARMEPPPQTLLVQQDVYSGELALESHIAFLKAMLDGGYYEARPYTHIVQHYLRYRDSDMPRVKGVQTLPLVLPDGSLLSRNGLDRKYGLVMRCDPKLLDKLPERAACDKAAVEEAMRFLLDDWLCDVAGDHAAKCVALAYALSIIERMLFGERPMFMVTSSQASSGKTTLLCMLVLAILGIKPPAAAWAMSEEERRKALFAYLLQGLPTLVWDNIPNSGKVQSASLDRAATTAEYADRVLGVTEAKVAPAHTIQCFTGNNIESAGDTASRMLEVRLLVPRSDPRNRPVKRRDPVEWTRQHRAEILCALYTLLLGNPQLGTPWFESSTPAEQSPTSTASDGRFKMWHRMVGAAIEYGSRIYTERFGLPEEETPVSFVTLFDKAEDENAERIDALHDICLLQTRWPDSGEFVASDVANWAKGLSLENREAIAIRERMQNARGELTTRRAGEFLSGLRDRPLTLENGDVLTLKRRLVGGTHRYWIDRSRLPAV